MEAKRTEAKKKKERPRKKEDQDDAGNQPVQWLTQGRPGDRDRVISEMCGGQECPIVRRSGVRVVQAERQWYRRLLLKCGIRKNDTRWRRLREGKPPDE